jgi:hypothetical protein
MQPGNKYRMIAITYMGNEMVPNVNEGRYIETNTNGVHFFSTSFSGRVGYNPSDGWNFIPMEDEFWRKSQC